MKKEDFKPHAGPAVTLENVGVVYKNFTGQKGMYNEEGERSFNIVIDDLQIAEQMLADGFNLKPFLDEDENVTGHHMNVKLNYKSRRPPRVYRVTDEGRNQLLLNAQTIGMLDSVTINMADLTLGTWYWRESDLPNVTVYCNVMYAHVEEDPLDAKYSDLLTGSYLGD